IFYGTTSQGGANNLGTIFQILADGTGFMILHSFDTADGTVPNALVQASDGALYGTTTSRAAHNWGAIFRILPDGSGFSVLHNFGDLPLDGILPLSALIELGDGTLYGTTWGTFFPAANGTVFRIFPASTEYEILRRFVGSVRDGGTCYAALLPASDGLIYGT